MNPKCDILIEARRQALTAKVGYTSSTVYTFHLLLAIQSFRIKFHDVLSKIIFYPHFLCILLMKQYQPSSGTFRLDVLFLGNL